MYNPGERRLLAKIERPKLLKNKREREKEKDECTQPNKIFKYL